MSEIVGAAAGYPILGLAIVLLWRLYVEVRKDRDFWRDTAMRNLDLADAGSKVAEVLVTPPAKPETPLERLDRLEAVADLLLRAEGGET